MKCNVCFYLWSKIEAIEAHWTEWTMCTVGAKSRDRTLQDGCLIDECETVTEECIPQGENIYSYYFYSTYTFFYGIYRFATLQHCFASQGLHFMDGIFCNVWDRHSCRLEWLFKDLSRVKLFEPIFLSKMVLSISYWGQNFSECNGLFI